MIYLDAKYPTEFLKDENDFSNERVALIHGYFLQSWEPVNVPTSGRHDASFPGDLYVAGFTVIDNVHDNPRDFFKVSLKIEEIPSTVIGIAHTHLAHHAPHPSRMDRTSLNVSIFSVGMVMQQGNPDKHWWYFD